MILVHFVVCLSDFNTFDSHNKLARYLSFANCDVIATSVQFSVIQANAMPYLCKHVPYA